MKLRERLGLSESSQRRATRLMELVLVGVFFVGVYELDPGVTVNAGLALLVTQLPPVLEREYDIPMDPALTLWITAAVFIHAIGVVGLPGSRLGFYTTLWWYDHLTHALSASVVAAAGYVTVRAIDRHSDDIYLPPAFTFVFILLITIAFGVLWEVIEFTVGQVSAAFGSVRGFSQHGLGDTMLDLVFDTIGAVIVATWGTAYLSDVVGAVTERLEREGSR